MTTYKIASSFMYLDGFRKEFTHFEDPKELREAVHVILYYLERLEMYASKTAKKRATEDTEIYFSAKAEQD